MKPVDWKPEGLVFTHHYMRFLLIQMMRIETMHIPREPNNKTGSEALKEFLEGDLGYVKFNIDNADDTYIKK